MGLNTIPANAWPPSSEQMGGGSGSQYELPIAGAETLGGVKVGAGLSINAETGILSADSQIVDYSTTEQETGQKWIDGRDVFVKTFSTSDSLTLSAEWTTTGLTIADADLIIDGRFVRYESKGLVPCGFNINNGAVRVNYNTSLTCSTGYAVTVYYTKTESEV